MKDKREIKDLDIYNKSVGDRLYLGVLILIALVFSSAFYWLIWVCLFTN